MNHCELYMKLSRTGWNNVIIFSVMIIILLINATNDRLFPEDDVGISNSAEQALLAQHSVILALEINNQVSIERIGKSWKISVINQSHAQLPDLNPQQIEQVVLAWQQASGLVQADDVVITGQQGIRVLIDTANNAQQQVFTLYPLIDQLLIKKQLSENHAIWLALPQALTAQLLPCCYH